MLPFSYKNAILICARLTRSKKEREFLLRVSRMVGKEVSLLLCVSMVPEFKYKGFQVNYVVFEKSLCKSKHLIGYWVESLKIGYFVKTKVGSAPVIYRFKWNQINKYMSGLYSPISGERDKYFDMVGFRE